tara:strand:+ start:2125 stop:2385 length:261 start_codon:yes stop_codon:yes gene_type:complete
MTNFREFLDYCMDFYNPTSGLYPIDGLTREELALATLNYLDLVASTDITWGDGDSLDRERVRDILIETRSHNQAFEDLIRREGIYN